VLLDQLLATAGIAPDDVPGPELGSHLEIALAVAAGITDAGLGVRAAATDLDLDFVSLTWEHYDIMLSAEALPTAASLITALREAEVREAITALGGYDPTQSGAVEALTPS
jgi:putative molybdopterin biosynthesis protein